MIRAHDENKDKLKRVRNRCIRKKQWFEWVLWNETRSWFHRRGLHIEISDHQWRIQNFILAGGGF